MLSKIPLKIRKIFLKNPGLFIITSTFLFVFLYMLPLRSQTYGDDFAYIRTIQRFSDTGIMKLSEWGSASQISQIYWTYMFTTIFGFSIQIVHFSNIFLFFIALIFFYFLLKRLTDELRATVFSIALLSFPWILHFTYTYLTDMFFVSFMIISLFFFVRAIQDNRYFSYFFGSIFAGIAYLSRQLGIVIPASIFLVLLYKSFVLRKFKPNEFIASLGPFLIMFLLYSNWLQIPGNPTNSQVQMMNGFTKQALPYITLSVLGNTGATFGYYATYLQRILLYFHHSIGFLLPLFLIFKHKWKVLGKLVSKYRKGIILAILAYIFIYCVNDYYHFALPRYDIEIPRLITRYAMLFPIDWNIYWKYFVYISVPIWLIVFAILIQGGFDTILKKRIRVKKRLYFSTFSITIMLVFFLQGAIFKTSFRQMVPSHYMIDGFSKFKIYLGIIFSPTGADTFKYTWLIILVLLSLVLIPAYVFTHYKFRRIKIKYESSFLFLAFVFQFSIIVFYMYFHWAQYIIPFIPFFLIALALFSKKYLSINPLVAGVVLFIMLMFSLNATNNRYQKNGIRWEMADKLVTNGVEPIDIVIPDESWPKWWYFEETFKIKAEELGSKYLITPGQWATWRTIKSESDYVYVFNDVPLDFKYDDEPNIEIVTDSGVQKHGFFGKKRVVGIKKLKH